MSLIDDPTNENDPTDPNAPAGLGPDDEGIGNIRPKPEEAEQRLPGQEGESPEMERLEDLGPRP